MTMAYNQNTMMQMNMMAGGMGMMGRMGMMNNPAHFLYIGNPISFQGRIQSITDEQFQNFRDATVTVTGTQLQALNTASLIMTAMCGGFLIFPLIFFCMNWWKRCTYPAYTIPTTVYQSMDRLFSAPNITNITITVIDNTFDQERARVLYNHLQYSRIKGFTFVNRAEPFDFNGNEYSDFKQNMAAIKQLPNLTSAIRWGREIVGY